MFCINTEYPCNKKNLQTFHALKKVISCRKKKKSNLHFKTLLFKKFTEIYNKKNFHPGIEKMMTKII